MGQETEKKIIQTKNMTNVTSGLALRYFFYLAFPMMSNLLIFWGGSIKHIENFIIMFQLP